MSTLTPRAHWMEARLALAMLPLGAVTLVVSTVALAAVLSLLLVSPFWGGGAYALWALVAAAVAVRNMLAGIAIMAAFDWRPVPLVLITSVAVVAGWLLLP